MTLHYPIVNLNMMPKRSDIDEIDNRQNERFCDFDNELNRERDFFEEKECGKSCESAGAGKHSWE